MYRSVTAVPGISDLWRQVSRRRAERTLGRLTRDMESLRSDVEEVRRDVYRGVFVKEVRRLVEAVAESLPAAPRRRRANGMIVSAPLATMLGLAGVTAVLLWDDRRRATMRRRLDEVVSSVSSNLNRAYRERQPTATP